MALFLLWGGARGMCLPRNAHGTRGCHSRGPTLHVAAQVGMLRDAATFALSIVIRAPHGRYLSPGPPMASRFDAGRCREDGSSQDHGCCKQKGCRQPRVEDEEVCKKGSEEGRVVPVPPGEEDQNKERADEDNLAQRHVWACSRHTDKHSGTQEPCEDAEADAERGRSRSLTCVYRLRQGHPARRPPRG